MSIIGTLDNLKESGNLRIIPDDSSEAQIADFTSNDYLGLSLRDDLRDEFYASLDRRNALLSSCASRLLAKHQDSYLKFENSLAKAYGQGRETLLFNSGYHANAGLVSAFAGHNFFILADKLVHASIIDGIKLSGLPFARFRHNDMAHLDRLAARAVSMGHTPIIIAESVYSMDGDCADIEALVDMKHRHAGTILYIDEAHAVGVEGEAGLGLAARADVDILVGTLGKALSSVGAFAILRAPLRAFMVNKARSLIFSTALPPLNIEWSRFIFEKSLGMDTERHTLKQLGRILSEELSSIGIGSHGGHIQPLVVGTPTRAVELSARLRAEGFGVLPIRVPTVPPGTDRLRFSLSAAIPAETIRNLGKSLRRIYGKEL